MLQQTVPAIQVQLDPTQAPELLEAALESFAWDVLHLYHDGYENNDGGYGTLSIDVAAAARGSRLYMLVMCGRIIQAGFGGMKILMGTPDDPRIKKPRYNGAPSQDLVVIRRHPETGENKPDLLRWGLVPYWVKDDKGGRKPINARAEGIAGAAMFKAAYAKRRYLVPVNGFFEWKAIKGAKVKQPFAIAMQDDSPFCLAGIWENWKHPISSEWLRTFCIITTAANELVGPIHDRMPVIIPPESYDRWLANIEPDPRDLLVPFP